MTSNLRAVSTMMVAAIALGMCAVHPAQATQTRNYVVSLFVPGMNSVEGDCPQGFNPDPAGMLRQALQQQNVPAAEVEKIFAADYAKQYDKWMANRGIIDGKHVSSY